MTAPVRIGDPVRQHVRRLEAERLRPAPELSPQEQLDADLLQVVAILAGALMGPGWRP